MPGPELRLRIIAEDLASRTLDSVARKMVLFDAEGKVAWNGLSKSSEEYANGLAKVEKATSSARGAFSELQSAVLSAFTVGAVLAFFKSSVQASEELSQAMSRLRTQVEVTGESFDEKKIEDWSQALQRVTRFSDSDYIQALSRAVQRTQDLSNAQKIVALAADIAVASHKNLADATEMLTLAAGGNQRGLAMLKREFPALLQYARNAQEAFEILSTKFYGTAESERGLTKESIQLKNSFNNLQEDLGKLLSPALIKVIEGLQSMITTYNELRLAQAPATLTTREQVTALEKLVEIGRKASREQMDRGMGSRQWSLQELKAIKDLGENSKKLVELRKKLRAEEQQDQKKTLDIEVTDDESQRKQMVKDATDYQKLMRDLREEELGFSKDKTEQQIFQIERWREAQQNALMEIAKSGNISTDSLLRGFEEIDSVAEERLRRVSNNFKAMEQVSDAVTSAISSGFASATADMILEGKGLEESMKAVFKSIARTAIEEFIRIKVQQMLVQQSMTGMMGGMLGFLPFAAFAGISSAFQHGTDRVPGPLGAPVPAIVHGGERIIPPGGAPAGIGGGGGGNTWNITLNIRVADLDPAERSRVLSALASEIRAASEPAREFSSEVKLLAERDAERAS